VSTFLTAADVAAQLGGHVTKSTVLAARRDGALTGRRIGRGWAFTQADVDAWVAVIAPQPTTAPVIGLVRPSSVTRTRLARRA
jgi:excisionase family DNA binding protein